MHSSDLRPAEGDLFHVLSSSAGMATGWTEIGVSRTTDSKTFERFPDCYAEKMESSESDLERVAVDLRKLGLAEGDTVLVRAGLRSLGDLNPNNGSALLTALCNVVGDSGTVAALTHTGVQTREAEAAPFTPETRSISGGLSNIVLAHDGSRRSRHPTNSFAAIGHDAEFLTGRHGPDDSCFGFVADFVERNALMLVIGCVEESPGFSTVHFTQEVLGLDMQTRQPNVGAWYEDADGERRWFERKDNPSCSRGFGNLYREYIRAGALSTGYVAQAYSIAGRSREVFDVERRVLAENPRLALCDSPICRSCRFDRRYNKRDIPRFLTSRGIDLGRKALRPETRTRLWRR